MHVFSPAQEKICVEENPGSIQPPSSVADPDPNPDLDPSDPHVFGPSGSGSISQMYGTGSGSSKIVRKTLISTVL